MWPGSVKRLAARTGGQVMASFRVVVIELTVVGSGAVTAAAGILVAALRLS
jgi:hypothetical protein